MKPPGHGLFASVRGLLATTLQLVRLRLELLGNEVELGAQRVFDSLVLMLLAAVGITVGAVMVCALILLAVQDAHRLQAAGALALLFLGAGAWLILAARAKLRQSAGAFEATRAELARDLEALTGGGPRPTR